MGSKGTPKWIKFGSKGIDKFTMKVLCTSEKHKFAKRIYSQKLKLFQNDKMKNSFNFEVIPLIFSIPSPLKIKKLNVYEVQKDDEILKNIQT